MKVTYGQHIEAWSRLDEKGLPPYRASSLSLSTQTLS